MTALYILGYLLISFVGAVLIRRYHPNYSQRGMLSAVWFFAWPIQLPVSAALTLIDWCARRLP